MVVSGRSRAEQVFTTATPRRSIDAGRTAQCFGSWICGYGSIPIDTFLVGWTSMNPSYFDVNYRGTRFWPIPMYMCRKNIHMMITYTNLVGITDWWWLMMIDDDDDDDDVLHMKWQYWEIPRFHGKCPVCYRWIQDVSPSRGHRLGWQRWHQKIQKELPMAPECSHQCLIYGCIHQ